MKAQMRVAAWGAFCGDTPQAIVVTDPSSRP
jgi:hypothetical protein